MKRYEAVICGSTPLLTDKFNPAELDQPTRRISAREQTPQQEAEAAVYRDKHGSIAFPGAALTRLLRDAGANHKVKGSRRSVRFVVPSAIRLPLEFIPLTNGDGKSKVEAFGVDSRPVVTRATKGRRMCHRARFEHWSLRFQLTINELLLDPELVRLLLTEGGEQLGIGAFRPSCGGPFGTFVVTEWGEVN